MCRIRGYKMIKKIKEKYGANFELHVAKLASI
jgi:hypothetical protein